MQILLWAGNFSIFSRSLFIFKLKESSALVQNPIFQFPLEVPAIWFLSWTLERNYPQKRFQLPVAKYGVKQPLSPPLFLPVFYFLQMYLPIYPDSSVWKNLIISGLNHMLYVMFSPGSLPEMMPLLAIINDPTKLLSMCWSALNSSLNTQVPTKGISHFKELLYIIPYLQ